MRIESSDLGYRLHCCDIIMSEIQHDLAALKEQKAIRDLLIIDVKEIATKVKDFKGVFLVHPYWR